MPDGRELFLILSSGLTFERQQRENAFFGKRKEILPLFCAPRSFPAIPVSCAPCFINAAPIRGSFQQNGFPTTKSILSAYLIQCNDEPRNPFNDCESGSKWPQRVSSLKGIRRHRKSASEETLIGGICIEFQLCFPPILPFVTTSCRYTHRTARSRRRWSA